MDEILQGHVTGAMAAATAATVASAFTPGHLGV
jgi:hypothetical protein